MATTPVLLPGKSHGWRGLVGCSPWGCEESMGSRRVGHNWATSLSLFTFMHWRRKWQPTPVFLPGESQGRRNLVGCHLSGRTELDTTEVTWQQQQQAHTRDPKFSFPGIKQFLFLQNCMLTDGTYVDWRVSPGCFPFFERTSCWLGRRYLPSTQPFREPFHLCGTQFKTHFCYVPVCVCAKSLQLTLCDPRDCNQVPLSMGFSRQECWGGLPCPPSGELPDPGMETAPPVAPASQADSLPLSYWGSPYSCILHARSWVRFWWHEEGKEACHGQLFRLYIL